MNTSKDPNENNTNNDFVERVLRYQEDSLSPEALLTLNEELRESPELRARFRELCQTSRMIREVSEESSKLADNESVVVENAWPWLFGRPFWKVAAVIALLVLTGLGIKSVEVFSKQANPAEVFVYGQSRLLPGAESALRIYVRNAAISRPISSAAVSIVLIGADASRLSLGEAITDESGMAIAQVTVPADFAEGDYTLEVTSKSAEGRSSVSRDVAVVRSFRTMLSTDKPLYQPGQIIHMRALSLEADLLVPAQDRIVAFEVRDPKGNLVFRRKENTSEFGIAAADFQLADQVNQGAYTIAVTVGDTTSERNVTVEPYVLPRYRIDLGADRTWYRPGEMVELTLDANYTFGKPVSGASVSIVAEEFIEQFRELGRVEGRTDEKGSFTVQIPLKEAFVGQELNKGDAFARLTAEVTDEAGETRRSSLQVKVSNRPIRIEAFPESGELVRGVENILYLVCVYPDGTPAQANLQMEGAGGQTISTSNLGIAKVKITPQKDNLKLTVNASDEKGQTARAVIPLRIGKQSTGLLLRSNRAVYKQGDSAKLSISSSSQARRAFVDIVKDSRSVATASVALDRGAGEMVIDLPSDLAGTLTLQAYAILDDGNLIRDTKLIQVHRANDLIVSAELDAESYRPAEKALLRFLVKDAAGNPVESALSLSAVDEAVFALNDARPGLEEMYFLIQEEILKPRYQLTALPQARFTDLPPEPPQELEEANVVVFSVGDGASAAPEVDRGETLNQRQISISQDKREFSRGLARFGLTLPMILFGLLLTGWLVHVFAVLGKRSTTLAGKGDLGEFRHRSSILFWTFYLGIFLPPLVIFSMGFLFNQMNWYRYDEEFLVGTGILLLVVSSIIIFISSWRLFRSRLVGLKLTRMRRLALVIGALFPLSWLTVIGIGFAIGEFGGNESVFIPCLLVVIVSLPIMASSILSLRRCYTRPKGLAMNGLSFVGQTFLCLLPIPILAAPILMIGGAAPKMAMATNEAVDTAVFEGALREFTEREAESLDADSKPNASEATPDSPRIRNFFPETLLWQPQLITDKEGVAELNIELADSITTWRMAGSAVSKTGKLGAFEKGIRVFQDFFIDIDFPVELTQGDEVSVPIAVFNYLDRSQSIKIDAASEPWFEFVDSDGSKTLNIGAGEVGKISFRIRALDPGRHALTVTAHGETLSDAVRRSVRIVPDGLRVEQTINGRLDGSGKHESVFIPESAIEGGSDLFVKIYPGAFSQVVEGMDSIFRMPHGCFEQTSSTTYPNILVLDYLTSTDQTKPEIEMKALNFINVGYQRLISYEVTGGGFSWFGSAPAHPILTAYGLMEFVDMDRVHEVDSDLIRRTRNWLIGLMNNDGSFGVGNGGIPEGAINAFQDQSSAKKELLLRNTAYISWAIAQAGGTDKIESAIGYIIDHQSSSNDPYTLALCANALTSADRNTDAGKILERLTKLATEEVDGVFWGASGAGLMHSYGDSFTIETTALVAQALLSASREIGLAHKALSWIISKKDPNGTWYSTQATVQAMRALLAGANSGGTVEGDTVVTLSANDAESKQKIEITEDNAEVFHLISFSDEVKSGENTVAIDIDGEGSVAWQIVAIHHEPHADTREPAILESPLSIDLKYSATTLAEDDLLNVEVSLQYNRPDAAPMTLVDLGIPPGFEVQTDSLSKLVSDGVIERFENNGRQVSLYVDSIPGGNKLVKFSYDLRAKFPVKAKAPVSAAYQYYEPEVRDETEPVLITVEAK